MKNKKLYVFVTIIVLVFCVIGVVVVIKTQNKPTRPFEEISKNNNQNSQVAVNPISKIYDKVLGVSDVATTIQQENSNSSSNNDSSTDTKNNDSKSDNSSTSSNDDSNDKDDSSSSSSSSSNNSNPTPTPNIFALKLKYISKTVDENTALVIPDPSAQSPDLSGESVAPSNYSDEQISNIFLPDLVDFFGTNELSKTFENVVKIDFTNQNIVGDEATAVAVLQLNDNTIKTYKTYFYLKNGEWYLYKTQEL